MKTTVCIDDDVMQDVKRQAGRRGVSFRASLNQLLRQGLQSERGSDRVVRPYRVPSVRMGVPRVPEPSLVKALALADSLEDEEIARKLESRK